MEIFVTGATRVLGRPVVQALIDAGHSVRALSRSKENAAVLRKLGADPVPASLFEVESLKPALTGSDAILHLATRIPPTMKMGRLSAWQENDHIRREGTRNLVEAALAVGGVQTFIYPSFAFVYPDSGDRWIDAGTTPVQSAATLDSTLDAEVAAASFAGRGIAAFPGSRDAYLPQIWIQDAARAIIAALMQPVPSGIYDIVDDEPLRRGDMFDAVAHAVGRKHLRPLPDLLIRMLLGTKDDDIHRSLRISNGRFKTVSNWQPAVSNARIGWARIVKENRVAERV